MNANENDNPNDVLLLSFHSLRNRRRLRPRTDASPSPSNALQLATHRQNDGSRPPLASAAAGRVDGLRDQGRQDWFLPFDDVDPDTAA